jgi:hypothetical protein
MFSKLENTGSDAIPVLGALGNAFAPTDVNTTDPGK